MVPTDQSQLKIKHWHSLGTCQQEDGWIFVGPPLKIISSPYPELDVLKAKTAQRKHRCWVRTGWIESGLVNLIPTKCSVRTVRRISEDRRSGSSLIRFGHFGTFRSVQSIYSRRPHVAFLVKKKIAALVRNREGILVDPL